VGRDKSDESIQEEKNLTGKIQYMEYELQILEDKYLLSSTGTGVTVLKRVTRTRTVTR